MRRADSIYLVAPHGELIWTGEKRAIVKSVAFRRMLDRPLNLISGNKHYGKIRLISIEEIKDKSKFERLRREHLITEHERLRWWGDKFPLYLYRFEVVERFRVPRIVRPPRGAQTFFVLRERPMRRIF